MYFLSRSKTQAGEAARSSVPRGAGAIVFLMMALVFVPILLLHLTMQLAPKAPDMRWSGLAELLPQAFAAEKRLQ